MVGKSGSSSMPARSLSQTSSTLMISCRIGVQRCLRPFASDVRSGSGHDVAAAQVDNLRYSEPCLEGHAENGVIAPPGPRGSIWRGQERIHFRPLKELHGSPLIAFTRYRQDLLTMK